MSVQKKIILSAVKTIAAAFICSVTFVISCKKNTSLTNYQELVIKNFIIKAHILYIYIYIYIYISRLKMFIGSRGAANQFKSVQYNAYTEHNITIFLKLSLGWNAKSPPRITFSTSNLLVYPMHTKRIAQDDTLSHDK